VHGLARPSNQNREARLFVGKIKSENSSERIGYNSVELVPNPVFLVQSMRHIGYTLETALADIIDNSIAANASEISVQYRWNDSSPWIAIIDNGCGMSGKELQAAMRFGGEICSTQRRSASDLGRFGLGLKTASLSQCKRLTVVSKKNGIVSSCVWDVDVLSESSDPQWRALLPSVRMLRMDCVVDGLLSKLDKMKSGTIVIWQKLDNVLGDGKKFGDRNFSEVMTRASSHIGLVFHRFFVMEKGSKVIKIDFNDIVVEGINPFGMAVPARQELQEETIVINGNKVVIQPFVLPHSSKVSKSEYEKYGGDEGYLHNQGFYVYRNRRLIIKSTWFRIIPKTELTKLLRVRIDIPNSLDHLWQLDVKKSSAYPPLAVLDRLKELLPTLSSRGKRPYTARGARAISDVVYIWRREFSNGKVSYVINDEHPFVKALVVNENGEVDTQKLSYLRIISDAFPAATFHVDVNNDAKTVIVPVAKIEEMENAVRAIITSYHEIGMSADVVRTTMRKHEFLISGERLEELIKEEFYG